MYLEKHLLYLKIYLYFGEMQSFLLKDLKLLEKRRKRDGKIDNLSNHDFVIASSYLISLIKGKN